MFLSVLAAAGALRFPGLFSSVFMDEVHILRGVSHYVSLRTIIPPWYDWPPLFSYLAVIPVALTGCLGGMTSGLPASEWALLESAFVSKWLVVGPRLLSLVFSLLTLWLVWKMIPRKRGVAVQASALLVYALSPVAVRYGTWGLPEAGMALGVAAALWMALRYAEEPRAATLLLAGVALGVAAAFKYNGALVAFSVAVSALCARQSPRRTLTHLALAALVSLVVFLVLTPSWLLVPARALDGFRFETRHVTTPRIGPRYSPYLGTLLFLALHEPGWLVGVLLGIVALFAKARRRALIVLALPLANYVVVGRWVRMDDNYWYPSLVGASVLVGEGVAVFSSAQTRWIWTGGLAFVLSTALWAISPPAFLPDNHDSMANWLASNLPADANVIRDGGYTPKVWDSSETQEFLQGRGARLSPRARKLFDQRLKHSAKAAHVWTSEALFTPGETTQTLSSLPQGTWVLTTSLPVQRVLETPPPTEPSLKGTYELRRRQYLQLFDTEGPWELMHQESRGSGQWQYAFLKRR